MSKRAAEELDHDGQALKSGERPVSTANGDDPEFEDEFEDEFESEDEILEAGVDGRPDQELEAEQREGQSQTFCLSPSITLKSLTECSKCNGNRSSHLHTRPDEISCRRIARA